MLWRKLKIHLPDNIFILLKYKEKKIISRIKIFCIENPYNFLHHKNPKFKR